MRRERPLLLHDNGRPSTVLAHVLVSTKNPGPRVACKTIRQLKGVIRADARFEGPLLIAIVEGPDLAEMDAGIDAMVEIPEVTDTESHVVRPIS